MPGSIRQDFLDGCGIDRVTFYLAGGIGDVVLAGDELKRPHAVLTGARSSRCCGSEPDRTVKTRKPGRDDRAFCCGQHGWSAAVEPRLDGMGNRPQAATRRSQVQRRYNVDFWNAASLGQDGKRQAMCRTDVPGRQHPSLPRTVR